MSISISIVVFKCGFYHVANYAWVTYSCEKTFSLVSNSLPLSVKTMGARFVAMAPAEMMSFVAAAYRSYREVATKLGEMETGRKGFIVMLTNSVVRSHGMHWAIVAINTRKVWLRVSMRPPCMI